VLWEAPEGTDEADRLDVLIMLIEAYEAEHYPIPDPDPIALIVMVKLPCGISKSRSSAGEQRRRERRTFSPFLRRRRAAMDPCF
jgi:antitoxin component HigA of HigAB toxin-antitoxin module